MLRPRTLAEIQHVIAESGYFKVADFSLTSTDSPEGTRLKIEYQYDPVYVFDVVVPSEKTTGKSVLVWLDGGSYFSVVGHASPGELSAVEPVGFKGLDGLREGIAEWLKRLRTELQTEPVIRQFAEQEQALADLLQQVQDLPDVYFSKEEAQDLVRRLEELERQLAENLSQNVADKNELASRVAAIHADIEMLKQNVGNIKKPGWARALVIRAAEWAKDPLNRQLLRNGAEVARDLLLEAQKHSGGSGQ